MPAILPAAYLTRSTILGRQIDLVYPPFGGWRNRIEVQALTIGQLEDRSMQATLVMPDGVRQVRSELVRSESAPF